MISGASRGRAKEFTFFLKYLSRELLHSNLICRQLFSSFFLFTSIKHRMERATARDDQYLTDLLSYSVDRLGKVRFLISFSWSSSSPLESFYRRRRRLRAF
jgi:hypothetical protein